MIFENLEILIVTEGERYEWFKKHLGNFVVSLGVIHAAYMSNHIDDYAKLLTNSKPEQQLQAVEILKPSNDKVENIQKKDAFQNLVKEIQKKEPKQYHCPSYQYSKEMLNSIKQWENIKLFSNPNGTDKLRFDHIGKKWEIGYGITQNAIELAIKYKRLPPNSKLPKTMTKKQADKMLEDVILPSFEDMVNSYLKVPVNRDQMNALVSFAYNLGNKRLMHLIGYGGYSTSEYPSRLNSGNYDDVPEIIQMYNKGNVGGTLKVLGGLDIRRKVEAEWFARNN